MKIVSIILAILLSSVSFGLSIYFYIGIKDSTGGLSYLVASIVFFLFISIDRLNELSVFGLTAKLKDKVKEADDLISELRELSMFMSKLSLSLVTRLGRWGTGYSFEEKHKIEIEMIKILKRLGIKQNQIDTVISQAEWDFHTIFDILSPVYSELSKLIDKRSNDGHEKFKGTITPELKPEHDKWIERKRKLREEKAKLEKAFKYNSKSEITELLSVLDYAFSACSIIPSDIKDTVKRKHEKDILAAKKYSETRTFPEGYTLPKEES